MNKYLMLILAFLGISAIQAMEVGEQTADLKIEEIEQLIAKAEADNKAWAEYETRMGISKGRQSIGKEEKVDSDFVAELEALSAAIQVGDNAWAEYEVARANQRDLLAQMIALRESEGADSPEVQRLRQEWQESLGARKRASSKFVSINMQGHDDVAYEEEMPKLEEIKQMQAKTAARKKHWQEEDARDAELLMCVEDQEKSISNLQLRIKKQLGTEESDSESIEEGHACEQMHTAWQEQDVLREAKDQAAAQAWSASDDVDDAQKALNDWKETHVGDIQSNEYKDLCSKFETASLDHQSKVDKFNQADNAYRSSKEAFEQMQAHEMDELGVHEGNSEYLKKCLDRARTEMDQAQINADDVQNDLDNLDTMCPYQEYTRLKKERDEAEATLKLKTDAFDKAYNDYAAIADSGVFVVKQSS